MRRPGSEGAAGRLGCFAKMRPRKRRSKCSASGARSRELLAQAQERHEPLAVGRVAEQQHLARAAQHDAQVARGLDEHLGDLAAELAEVGEQRARAARAVAARLLLDARPARARSAGRRRRCAGRRCRSARRPRPSGRGGRARRGRAARARGSRRARCRAGRASRSRRPPRARRAGAPSARRCRGRGCSRRPPARSARAPRPRRGSGCRAPRACRRAGGRSRRRAATRSRRTTTARSATAATCSADERAAGEAAPARAHAACAAAAAGTATRPAQRVEREVHELVGRRSDRQAAARHARSLLQQLLAGRPHAAGAERQHHVALAHLRAPAARWPRAGRPPTPRPRWPRSAIARASASARDARDRLLRRRVDVGEQQHVGLVEGAGRSRPRAPACACSGAAGRAPRVRRCAGAAAQRLERRPDLGRVVAVVVDHEDAARLAAHLEAPVDAGERLEARPGSPRRRRPRSRPTATAASEFATLWAPGHGERDRARAARRRASRCSSSPSARASRSRAETLRLRREAVGHHAPLDARQDVLHRRVVEAQHGARRRTAPCSRSRRTPPGRRRGRGRRRGARGRCW